MVMYTVVVGMYVDPRYSNVVPWVHTSTINWQSPGKAGMQTL